MESDLIRAAEQGDLRQVTDLLTQGININCTNSSEETPILKAARSGHDRIVGFLLEQGADPNIRNSQGSTPLIEGASCGHTEIVKLLLENGANPNARDLDGNSGLSLAVGRGHVPTVNLLVRGGAHTDLADSDGDTPLILAARSGNVRILDLLANVPNPEGETSTSGMALPSLGPSGRSFEIQLSRPSEKIKQMHYRGVSSEPLQQSAAYQNDLLGTIGLGTKNGHGDTALIEAARYGHPEVVKILLRAQAQVDEVNLRGQTALLAAAAGGHATVVELLLGSGADPRVADYNGETALILAARNGFDQVIEKILPKLQPPEPHLKVAPPSLAQVPQSAADDEMGPLRLDSLAEFLFEFLGEQVLLGILDRYQPSGAKGPAMERLKETLNEKEPDSFLRACLVHKGELEALAKLGIGSEAKTIGGSLSSLLNHFGLPTPVRPVHLGPFQVLYELERLATRISHSSDDTEIKGAFLDACSALEKLLKMALWGWAQLVFGERRDEKLIEALKANVPGNYRLDRLTFGHVVGLFRELPKVVAMSPEVSLIESKLGRSQIYTPYKKKSPFADWLNSIVVIRNKMVHDSGGLEPIATPTEIREQIADALGLAEKLVSELMQSNEIPRIGIVSEETRDKYHRVRYNIIFDNGTSVMVYSSQPLLLGSHYLYFGSQNNPHPVDPLMLPLEEIEDMP